MTGDMISRQAAISVVGFAMADSISITREDWNAIIEALEALPSVQPEKRTEKRTETHACDLIDRQAAIDVADAVWSVTGDKNVAKVWDQIKDLPSVQPEIIYCKDCKFWTHIKRTKRHWCKTDDGLYDLNTSADDFCSRAERREE